MQRITFAIGFAVIQVMGHGTLRGAAPAPPTGVVAYAGDSSVIVQWNRNPEPAVSSYTLYGADSEAGPFALLTPTRLRSPAFADVRVTNGQARFYRVRALNPALEESADSPIVSAEPHAFRDDDEFLDYVQRANFGFFWYEANPTNGLVPDRSTPTSPCSIAAVGFGLSAITIGIDHGWITREEGRDRVRTTLQTFWDKPQGASVNGNIGHRGWFYHFLDMKTASRVWSCELSSIDTALLLAGVLHVREYFDAAGPEETAIRSLANALFGRVDWNWMRNGKDSLTMGWKPESGFLTSRWIGYNEAMLLYLMGLGADPDPLPAASWPAWTSGYVWRTNHGQTYVPFPPLFGHQYSHCWVDFRHTADDYMRGKSTTYFENSRRATLAQQAYCAANPRRHPGYSTNVWGLTACDGPGTGGLAGYSARGAPPPENDDGTLAPTAVGGSVAFAPEICVPTLRHLYERYRASIWTGYGFRDAFNLRVGWWDPDTLGIDQGPFVLMIENYRTQRVWKRFMQAPEIRRGLERARFQPVASVQADLEADPAAGTVMLSWPATSGVRYQVEYSPDLDRWFAPPTGALTADNPLLTWLDAGPPATSTRPDSASARFYSVFQFGPP